MIVGSRNSDPRVRNFFLEQIESFIDTNGYSPSIRDICRMTGRATGTVYRMLVYLQEDGLIDWEPGQARTLRVVEPGERYVT